MKFVLRAAIAAVSIGSIPPAFADVGDPNPNTEVPGIIAQAPTQHVPSIATAQREQADTQTGHGPWLFPPIGSISTNTQADRPAALRRVVQPAGARAILLRSSPAPAAPPPVVRLAALAAFPSPRLAGFSRSPA